MTDFKEKLDRFRIPLADLRTATNDFAEENLSKRGYNSDFYEGKLQLWSKVVTGRDVVIQKFRRTHHRFHDINEQIKIISGFNHKIFVCFIGFCEEEGEKMIVMERVVNGSLHRHLSTLTCLQKLKACFDVAVALKDWIKVNAFSIYRYGIAFKIMLDKDWKAKILLYFEPDKEHSVGYLFGKMFLEVLYGRKVTNEDVIKVKEGYDMIDPYLKKEMLPDSLSLFLKAINKWFEDPKDFIDVGIPLLQEAYEIQWKHKNPQLMEKIQHLKIPLNIIKSATSDFSRTYTWHCDVYKATLGEMPKKKVFIKRTSKEENVLKTSFIEKIEMLTHYKHPSNQVTFLGFCDEESEMILVFEYTFKENLEYYGDTAVNVSANSRDLTWHQRICIYLEIAHGLQLTTMISIVELFEIHPKYSDFLEKHKRLGLPEEDIYLFGVFLFEILTGSWNYHLLKEVFASGIESITRLKDIVDPWIRDKVAEKSLDTFIGTTCKCLTFGTPNKRPTWEDVVKSLEEVIRIHVVYMSDFEKNLARFRIPLADLRIATNNFAGENLLKRGYNSDFYEGKLQLWSKVVTGRDVVIQKFRRTHHRFHNFNEWIKIISGLKHKNFVCSIGFCDEEGEQMIVMERVVNGSLHRHLSTLTCLQRLKACFDVAVALKDWIKANDFSFRKNVIDFKIMLDKDWKAKILVSFEPDKKHSVAYFLKKMLLEVLYGRKATNEDVHKGSTWGGIIDPYLKQEMHQDSLYKFCKAIITCDENRDYFIYDGIHLLEEAYEIQWKHKNLQLLEKIEHLKIPLNVIKSATTNFSRTYIWHRDVYKAKLGEMPKKKVFIKRTSKEENVLKTSFIEKIEMLIHYKHPSNQVLFLGFCDEESEMILVFEYTFKENIEYYWDTGCSWTTNVSVNSHDLTWLQRICICLDIAHGLQLTIMTSIVELFEIHPTYSVFLQEHKRLGLPDEDIYLFGVFLFEILIASCNYHLLQEVFARGIESITRLKDIVDLRIRDEGAEKSLDTFIEITCKCLTFETTNKRPTLEDVIKSLEEVIRIHVKEQFTIPRSVIMKATNDFDEKYIIGSGGFGKVYKAELYLSSIESFGEKLRSRCNSSIIPYTVAIKRIKINNPSQGYEGLSAELDALYQCEDPNIVTLLAYCEDDKEMLLVYEYASNGSLDNHFDGTIKEISFRQWTQRLKICIDIAKGLEYLHTKKEYKSVIVHRDIKSGNILLFENMMAKIADFGLSKVRVGQESTINTVHCAGTDTYIDPEYFKTFRLKKASDIYSFGVVLFEIFSGKLAYDQTYTMQNQKGIAPIARRHCKNETLKDILDVELMDEASELGLSLKVRPDRSGLFGCIFKNCISVSVKKSRQTSKNPSGHSRS